MVSKERPVVGKARFPSFAHEQQVPDWAGPSAQQDGGLRRLLSHARGRSWPGRQLLLGLMSHLQGPRGCS